MPKHRVFNSDRFLDKFQGRESLLRQFAARWDGQLEVAVSNLDVPSFKNFLVNGDGRGKDDLLENLYRAHDLCSERGHEDIIAACRESSAYDPDPEGELPVECLSLKVLMEQEEAFNLAYDRHTLWNAERFSVYLGQNPTPISDVESATALWQQRLAEVFKEDKKSERVLVRRYREGDYMNFIVYHEQRTKAELIFGGSKMHPKVAPQILRPAQQDFVSYNEKSGQLEIEARYENECSALRKCFAECFFGDSEFFEGEEAARRLDLARIADEAFAMPVDDEHSAALVEIQFALFQQHRPSFIIRSKNVMETLNANYLTRRLSGGAIRRAVFHIIFPDDRRGKRVILAGTNSVSFKRATHAEEVFRYLRNWGLLLG